MSKRLEREVLWTGIGGQGVQLAAKILALAAMSEGRKVMSLGTYGGTMRGGNTDATIVIADDEITSPPMVSKAWSAVIAHPRYFEPIRPKLGKGGVIVVDGELRDEPLPETPAEIISIPATTLAREADAPKAAALILLGAFAQATGIVSASSLDDALAESLPSYRQQFLESNLRALATGFAAVQPLTQPAWTSEAA
jgi:2-oxoacid:acceptor oxidoreductase gamma subunit (pyruvate/2-ketoisovalerate family)